MDRTRLERAQWIADKGISVFIVNANSKRPLGGHSWMSRHTTDPQQIADWFDMEPDCNYGVWLRDHYAVIDLDVKHDTDGTSGITAFEEICVENGIEDFLMELDTLTIHTPSGGYHLYFRTPFKVANKNTFPNLIDVRGAVGYVVGPGSRIGAGEYEVMNEDAPIMDVPEFLLQYLTSPGYKDPNHHVPLIELDQAENIAQAEEWIKDQPPAIEGEEGDFHTFKTVCSMRDFGITEGEALRILCECGWNAKCEPPWDAAHLEIKVKNSYEYAENRPGVKAVTYERAKLMMGRPAGGWASVLTDEQFAAMGRPKTVEELGRGRLELVAGTDVSPEDDVPEDVGEDEDPLAEFRSNDQFWYGIEDFAAIEQVREYLVKGWLIAHGVTALLAKRGTGKSTIALDLAMHIAKDIPWWGIDTMKGWKVIYICGEDDEGMILNVRAWAQYEDRGLPHNDRFRVAKGIIKMTDKALLGVRLEEMKEWADGERCLVILDTWARATSGYSSNTQEEMDTAYENAELVANTLKGPMLACFHPPKDGRMTIRGSAVQEDASSGIWELEKETDCVRLTIGRAKGKGEGNYRKFKLEPLDLTDTDEDGAILTDVYGDVLQGLVPINFAGTESEGTSNHQAQQRSERYSWARAVIGALEVYPSQNPGVEKCSNTISGIAKFLTGMWVNRGRTESDIEQAFVAEWMDGIREHDLMSGVNRPGQDQTVVRTLDTMFLNEHADHNTVIVGRYTLTVKKKGTTQNKYHFVIGEAETGKQE